ncbi:MAG: tRNA (adenosine(37)-N6)-dimethylallyltransferase MiaA [Parvularculaceae bacterium]|nr:tRNA (adenosine(37)-N6)-dimethylallyltransferase MiaA [Parvularculaceae bacterium]
MPEKNLKRVVFIAGPTASGKSAAALLLARRIGGEIVNADAIQVYRDLRILSARPTAREEAMAPHHLYGHVDGAERYSAGRWARDSARVIADIHARGRAAIVCGGTGLYFRALEFGLSAAPNVPAEVVETAEARWAAMGPEKFRQALLAVDPQMARLAPADRQRHIRAWAVYQSSGAPLSEIQAQKGAPGVARSDARVVIEPPREALYQRIEARYDEMVSAGAPGEAAALAARRLDRRLPVMKAVGAAELLAAGRGEIDAAEAIALAKRNTRRFAKRQMTWFRNQAADWPRAADAETAVTSVTKQLEEGGAL